MGRPISRVSYVAWCLGLSLLLASWPAHLTGQGAADTLPLDPAIYAGVLPNGFHYFIRRNPQPPQRVMMRLVVKAGSVDEADDQRGVAHALEHVAFTGSTHFAPGALVRYFESLGVRFGPHINAGTSYDQTVYVLDVPTDRDGALQRGIDALSDVAQGLTLDERELDRERGVIVEEWRSRLGAASRAEAPRLAALFGASRYADHRPIGTPESIRAFSAQRLRDFYAAFYRPDRMALIVVGDVDVAGVEAMARTAFSGMPAREAQIRRPPPIPAHTETRYAVVADAEIQATTVMLAHKRQRAGTATVAGFRERMLDVLVFRMLSERFAESARLPGAPYLGVGVNAARLAGDVEVVSTTATVADGGIPAALQAMTVELKRIRELGFGEEEISLAKRDFVSSYDRMRTDSTNFADRIQSFFLLEQAIMAPAAEVAVVKAFAPLITASDLQARVRVLFGDDSRVVIATMPDRPGLPVVTETALRAAMDAGAAAPVTARPDVSGPRELMTTLPTPGTVRSRREIAELGVTVLTLSNGVEVWLKPTSGGDVRIEFSSYARGGALLSPPDQYFAVSMAPLVINTTGVGGLTPLDVSRVRGARLATVTPYINAQTHGVTGETTIRDLELALQLTYLYFTAPNADREAFERVKAALGPAVAATAENPATVFNLRRQRLNTNNNPRFKQATQAEVTALDIDRVLGMYRSRFANAANFTFVFAGPFTEAGITPPLLQYLGALPSTGTPDPRPSEDRLEFPAAIVRDVFAKGREPRTQTAVTFFADTRLDELESLRARMTATILEAQLRQALREQLGAIYTVDVQYADFSPTPGFGTLSIQFVSAPENSERLTAAVLAEVDRLRTSGPNPATFAAAKEAYRKQLETAWTQSLYWTQSLLSLHILGRDPRTMSNRAAQLEAVAASDIQDATRKYFDANRYTVLTMNQEP